MEDLLSSFCANFPPKKGHYCQIIGFSLCFKSFQKGERSIVGGPGRPQNRTVMVALPIDPSCSEALFLASPDAQEVM